MSTLAVAPCTLYSRTLSAIAIMLATALMLGLTCVPYFVFCGVRGGVIERPDLDDTYTMLPAFTIAIAALQVVLSKTYNDSNTSFFILHSLVNAAITFLVWPVTTPPNHFVFH